VQQRFTISEVAADRHELMILQCIMGQPNVSVHTSKQFITIITIIIIINWIFSVA